MTGSLTERQVQRAIVQHIRAEGYIVAHVPNGAHLAGGFPEKCRKAEILKADGMVPGFPDLVVLGPDGRTGFIECKRPKAGRVSDEQQALKDRLESLGHCYALATAPDAWGTIKQQWGWA